MLCTRDRTYALKHVQTTNTVLLMPCDAEVRLLHAMFSILLPNMYRQLLQEQTHSKLAAAT